MQVTMPVPVPVTALVFSQTPCGILPLTVKSQQQNTPSPSQISSLEGQMYYLNILVKFRIQNIKIFKI